MAQNPYKVGAPTLVVNFYTREKTYELYSKVGDPNTDILSVSTTKDLNSSTGSFTIDMVPQKDSEGKTWYDKLQFFDYVEIRMKGIRDSQEHVVMRGLIDTVSKAETFGDIPRRTITITGRDLGILLTDFSIWYCPMLDWEAADMKILSWLKTPEAHYTMEHLFGVFLKKWKEAMEITVGKPTYGDTTTSSVKRPTHIITSDTSATLNPEKAAFQRSVRSNVLPSTSINLSGKIDTYARSIIPNMKSFFQIVSSFEGSFWNLFQTYQDKPFHEMFIWDADDNSKFVIRPARLKDGRGNLYKEVRTAVKDMGPAAYPNEPFWTIEPEEKVSSTLQKTGTQLNNYYFTKPENGLLTKCDFFTFSMVPHSGDPWNSINPFISVKPPTSKEEPMAYVGRYGFRKYEIPIRWMEIDIGQQDAATAAEKDPDHPAPVDAKGYEKIPSSAPPPSIENAGIPPNISSWEPMVEKACQKAGGSDKAMVYAIMKEKSNGNSQKITRNPATGTQVSQRVGLMQIDSKVSPTYTGGTTPPANLDEGAARVAMLSNKYKVKEATTEEDLVDRQKKVAAAYHNEKEVDKQITSKGDQWFDGISSNIQKEANDIVFTWTLYRRGLATDKSVKENTQFWADIEKNKKIKMGQGPTSAVKSFSTFIDGKMEGYIAELNYILVAWYLQNHFFTDGSIVINGRSDAIVGTYVFDRPDPNLDKDPGMEYYVEGVSHNFRVFESYTTTLTVSRGQPQMGGIWSLGKEFQQRFYFDEAITQEFAIPPEEERVKAKDELEKKKERDIRKQPLIRLPDEKQGCGYYYYGHPTMRYGTSLMIEMLKSVGKKWFALHPTRPFGIGDLSLEYGGENDRHKKSHRNGTNVDIRPVRTDDNKGAPPWYFAGACNCFPWGNPNYSQALTQEFIGFIKNNGIATVTQVLFQDLDFVKRGVTQSANDHSNHLHIQIAGGYPSGTTEYNPLYKDVYKK